LLDDEESDTEHSSSEKHVEQNQTKDYEQMVVDNNQGNEFKQINNFEVNRDHSHKK